jgi:peptidoglycan-associated lipoprotein
MRAPPRTHAFLLVAATLVATFALVGCPNKKPKTPACDSTADCKDGLACINKQCQKCSTDPDCGDGMACQAGVCVAKPECASDDDCPGGKVCKAGTCAACGGDAECGPGGKCSAGACERPKKCASDDDCAEDEDCTNGRCLEAVAPPTTDTACALTTVYFAFDDSSVRADQRDPLDADGTCIQKETQHGVYLVGHTDSSGTEEYNIALSERRARAVADYLARLGIDPDRLQIIPKGETEPSGLGDEKDRRVELQFH